ncbi:GNAT family N-acetyltransferase [Rhizobium sp. SG2393]|uniref:GNAT family N-acetyltransferase n=1 Tax=Rhizobium sp. SG2393 TaxID=3276279 RepID=UPI0036714D3B
MSDIEFRDLRGMAEFRAAERLQADVWGEGDMPDPADLMMVIQAEGGLVGGAFLTGDLVGYVFGFPSATPNVQHSHRLAVLPQMRGRGLGARLKWYQRQWCLARGIRHVRWTFDPMRPLNANLNLAHLGARSNTYHEDYYGAMGGINEGLPSDRLLVDWHLDHAAVTARAAGRGMPQAHSATTRISLPVFPPASLPTPQQAAAQHRLRQDFHAAFASGLEVIGFDLARNDYLLGPVNAD